MNKRVFGLSEDLFCFCTTAPSLLTVAGWGRSTGFLGGLSSQRLRLGTGRLVGGLDVVGGGGFITVDGDSCSRIVRVYILVLLIAEDTIEKAPMRGGSPIGCARQFERLE